MSKKAFQDYYAEDLSHCYGCGRLNDHGLKIKSYWEGDASVCHFVPESYHCGIPGYVYGGLIASLFDCHGTATASAAARRQAGEPSAAHAPRFVTAALHVDYIKPTPLGELEIKGVVDEIKSRKVVVSLTLAAAGSICAKGKVIAVRMPDVFLK